jgi:hypothetical protein
MDHQSVSHPKPWHQAARADAGGLLLSGQESGT